MRHLAKSSFVTVHHGYVGKENIHGGQSEQRIRRKACRPITRNSYCIVK